MKMKINSNKIINDGWIEIQIKYKWKINKSTLSFSKIKKKKRLLITL